MVGRKALKPRDKDVDFLNGVWLKKFVERCWARTFPYNSGMCVCVCLIFVGGKAVPDSIPLQLHQGSWSQRIKANGIPTICCIGVAGCLDICDSGHGSWVMVFFLRTA